MSTSPAGNLQAPGLFSTTTPLQSGSSVFHFSRLPTREAQQNNPILVLIHGFPQTSYEWRKIIPLIPSTYPLFIPDLPGYGRSTLAEGVKEASKRTIGKLLLEALYIALGSPSTATPIILIGHDRGARIAHRLALDFSHAESSDFTTHEALTPHFDLHRLVCIDTVPEPAQWASFATPTSAVSTHHWPFLASPLAEQMILAYGANKWCRHAITSWSGLPERVDTEGALDHYCEAFERPGAVRTACMDYAAGANEDVELLNEDLKAGRRVQRDVLVMYSGKYLGKKFENVGGVGKVWQEYVERPEERLSAVEVGDGAGHFLPEEAPEEVAKAILEFVDHGKRY